MVLQREVAHRLFATEFNASRHVIQGEGEKDPSYVVSPLGAKVNRVHIVGVCTDVEAVGDSGEVWRARISDPTGVFTVYAGQYQPDAAHALSNLQPPQYVAVTGKARTYEPEPGSVFVSVRPEHVSIVDEGTRDEWILQAAQRSIDRLEVCKVLRQDPRVDPEDLAKVANHAMDAHGATLAQEAYGLTDTSRFQEAIADALRYVRDGEVPIHRVEPRDAAEAPMAAPAWKPSPQEEGDEAEEALDASILAQVQALEGDAGAQWDDVLKSAAGEGATAEQVEEALNRLMDKGLVYEPTLGVLKTT